MAARKCPQCMAAIPAGHAVAYSNEVECPGCKAKLEVSEASRIIAALAGLLAAVLAWRLTSGGEGTFAWVLPVLYSIVAFGIVSPLALIFVADLRMKPAGPPQEPVEAQDAHGQGGHAAHH